MCVCVGGGGGKQRLMSDSCRNQNIVSSCILMSGMSRLETGRRFNLFRAIFLFFLPRLFNNRAPHTLINVSAGPTSPLPRRHAYSILLAIFIYLCIYLFVCLFRGQVRAVAAECVAPANSGDAAATAISRLSVIASAAAPVRTKALSITSRAR